MLGGNETIGGQGPSGEGSAESSEGVQQKFKRFFSPPKA